MLLKIQLPDHDAAIEFNRLRWAEVHSDPQLLRNPNRIETNAWGQIIMTPPPSSDHSARQTEIVFLLRERLGGRPLVECPISTADGVRAADVAWCSSDRYSRVRGQLAFEIAPEICVEVASPGNTKAELTYKQKLYFAAGAIECWTCNTDGQMTFCHRDSPDTPTASSQLCPDFPHTIANP